MKQIKKNVCVLLVLALVLTWLPMLPVTAYAEELETFTVGEYKQDVEVPQGKIGKQYVFTPTEDGIYAFTGYVGTLTAMNLYVSDGTQTIASYELPLENDSGNGACIFEAKAGQTYTLSVMVGNVYGGDIYHMMLRLEKAVAPTGVYLSDFFITGSVGDEFDLTMRFDPLWAIPEDYTWSVDDASVASIDANGHLTMLADGDTTVKLTTASGLSAECNIEVITTSTASEIIELDGMMTITIQPGEQCILAFTAPETDEYCIYTEEDDGWIRRLDDTNYTIERLRFYLSQGSEEYFVIKNGGYMTRTYTVHLKKTVPAERVEIQGPPTAYVGDEIMLTPKTFPIWTITHESYSWASSNSSVATVESSYWGFVTCISEGTTDITVTTSSGATHTVTLVVKSIDEEILCGESKELTLDLYESACFHFTPEESGDYVFYMPEGKLVWDDEIGIGYSESFYLSVEQDGVGVGEYFYIDAYTGVFCEMTAGNTYILRATYQVPFEFEEEKSETRITGTVFLDKMIPPEAITITSAQDTFFVGDYISLSCKPEEGTPFMTEDVIWSVSDESVLSLDYTWSGGAGFIANAVGKSTVTATLDNGVSASYEVVVTEYEYHDYGIISGDGAVVVLGSGEHLPVRIDCSVEKFDGSVFVDGNSIPNQYYTVTEGSTVITLSAEYLDTLEIGWHTLCVGFTDGSAFAGFEIREKPDITYGDANGDGKVTTVDLAMLRRYLAAMDPITGVSTITVQAGADVNGDGNIGTVDLAMLRRYLAAMDPVTGESTIVLGPR